jgi:hypothetical protein
MEIEIQSEERTGNSEPQAEYKEQVSQKNPYLSPGEGTEDDEEGDREPVPEFLAQ